MLLCRMAFASAQLIKGLFYINSKAFEAGIATVCVKREVLLLLAVWANIFLWGQRVPLWPCKMSNCWWSGHPRQQWEAVGSGIPKGDDSTKQSGRCTNGNIFLLLMQEEPFVRERHFCSYREGNLHMFCAKKNYKNHSFSWLFPLTTKRLKSSTYGYHYGAHFAALKTRGALIQL